MGYCPTCAFVPAVNTASAISCFGSSLMPSCISPTCSGRTSNTMPCALRWPILLRVNVASVKRANRSKLEPGLNAETTDHHCTYPAACGLVRVFPARGRKFCAVYRAGGHTGCLRSEEHTSELQSHH